MAERRLSSISHPPLYKLKRDDILDPARKPKLYVLFRHLFLEGLLEEEAAKELILEAIFIFKPEKTLLRLRGPTTICGDIHGQFYDLPALFNAGGPPEHTQYLFLGDYVDRGCFSVECIFYLYALKICYQDTFFLLRGNHECRRMTSFFTFKKECLKKYSSDLYELIMKSFDALPLAAVVDDKIFCVHGGISPLIRSLNDIDKINRFREIPVGSDEAMCDLLWADPAPNYEDEHSQCALYMTNRKRRTSCYYSHKACVTFLAANKLSCVVRAHELPNDDGYYLYRGENGLVKTPHTVATVFSAPNYTYYRNKGCVFKYKHDPGSDDLFERCQFPGSPHPYWLPNFHDAFSITLPLIVEQLVDIHESIYSIGKIGPADRWERLRRTFTVVRRMRQSLAEQRKCNDSDKRSFEEAAKLDSDNESVPDCLLEECVTASGMSTLRTSDAKFDNDETSDFIIHL